MSIQRARKILNGKPIVYFEGEEEMDRFYNHMFQNLRKWAYEAIRYEEHVYMQKQLEDLLLLVRVIPEQLPGQNPVDLQAEHALMEEVSRKLMIKHGKRVETLLLLVLNDLPNHNQVEEAENYDDIWFLNRRLARVYIYENQKSDFYGLRDRLEESTSSWNAARKKDSRKQLLSTFTPVNTGIIAINILVFLVLTIIGDTNSASFMADHGGMVYYNVVFQGQYYLMFTSMFLHFGFPHIAENMLVLLLTGRILERSMGKIRYLIIYLASGFVSSLASLMITLSAEPNMVSAGASGCICGVIGAIFFLILENVLAKEKRDVEGLSVMNMIFMIGLTVGYGFLVSDVDNAAHIGGLFAGFLITALLEFIRMLYQKNKKI